MEKSVKLAYVYHITFADGTVFCGGPDYFTTKWDEIPRKPIARIIYRLPYDCLTLFGYDKYYHLVEATRDLNGKDAGKPKTEYAYIMGKKGKDIICYRIALCDKGQNKQNPIENHVVGDIKILHTTEDSTFIRNLNPEGWR